VTPHKKDNPGKKRKNNKKSKSRKRYNAAPDKEVILISVLELIWSSKYR